MRLRLVLGAIDGKRECHQRAVYPLFDYTSCEIVNRQMFSPVGHGNQPWPVRQRRKFGSTALQRLPLEKASKRSTPIVGLSQPWRRLFVESLVVPGFFIGTFEYLPRSRLAEKLNKLHVVPGKAAFNGCSPVGHTQVSNEMV
jgi:hypothetical protein